MQKDFSNCVFFTSKLVLRNENWATRLLHNQTAYVREHAAFVEAVRTGGPLPMPPEEARAALRLALGAVESARTGRAVSLVDAGASEVRA